jgi:hypothetical protein
MIKVFWESFNKYLKFIVVHCFNNELFIVGKEKEAARFALALTRIKCLISI